MKQDIETKYARAKDRVQELKKFYGKLTSGILAIFITGGINYYTNEWEHPWFLWVVFGVGLSVTFKAVKVFGMGGALGKNWEEKKIKEILDKEQNQQRWS